MLTPRRLIGVVVVAVVSPLLLVPLLADEDETGEQPRFKQSKAREAEKAYQKAVANADAEYQRKVRDALKAYTAALKAAKTAATRAGDLEDANAIDAAMKKAAADSLEAPSRSGKGRQLVFTRVRYGIEGKMTDITKLVNERVKNDFVDLDDLTSMLPDPQWGARKSFVCEGTFGGKPFVLNAPHELAEFGARPAGKKD